MRCGILDASAKVYTLANDRSIAADETISGKSCPLVHLAEKNQVLLSEQRKPTTAGSHLQDNKTIASTGGRKKSGTRRDYDATTQRRRHHNGSNRQPRQSFGTNRHYVIIFGLVMCIVLWSEVM